MPSPFIYARRAGYAEGLGNQAAVIRALILRELQARFGRRNIGYLWMIAEPMMLASVITLLHYAGHFGMEVPGLGPYPFTLLGYCLFIVFRNTFNRAESAIAGSRALMYHGMIKPFDIMVAKAAVETFGAISAFIILLIIGIMAGVAHPPARPLYLYAAIVFIAWWTFGLALVVASYSYTNHIVGRFVHPFSYFMVPLSGAFVTMDFLPRWAQEGMAWNPMMGMFEMARYGQFQSASDHHIYWGYIIAHCAFATYWGLIAMRRLRQHIHVG